MKKVPLMSAVTLICSGCAGPSKQEPTDDHAAHHPAGTASGPAVAKADQQLKRMREMHQKMETAKTPQERAALVEEHMKVMQDGMAMMCNIGGNTGMGAQGSAGSKDALARCMEMKDMTMHMMMDREGPKAPAVK